MLSSDPRRLRSVSESNHSTVAADGSHESAVEVRSPVSGGTLIQDRTSVRSALYYLTILAAGLTRRQVAVVGRGSGPFARAP